MNGRELPRHLQRLAERYDLPLRPDPRFELVSSGQHWALADFDGWWHPSALESQWAGVVLLHWRGGAEGNAHGRVRRIESHIQRERPEDALSGELPRPNAGRSLYDVSRDGQRFLMIKNAAGEEGAAALQQMIVVQHFDEELKRLMPTK